MKKLLVLVALCACGSSEPSTMESTGIAESTEGTEGTEAVAEAEQADPSEPSQPLDPSREPTEAQVRAIVAALGCPADSISADGCSRCVALDADLRPTEAELDGPASVTIVLGRFVPDTDLGAMVTVEGCSTRAAGDHQVHVLAFDGAWRPVKNWSYNDRATCVYPRRSDGREHIICVTTFGAQGCYDSEIDSPRALPLEGMLGHPSIEECGERDIRITSVEDRDGDGDDDVAYTVNGEAGLLRQGPTGFTTE